MKFSASIFSSAVPALAGMAGVLFYLQAGAVHAADQDQSSAPAGEHQFATPDDAVKALQTAAATRDPADLKKVFGPDFKNLMTGDAVEDSNNATKFADALAAGCNQAKDGDNRIVLEIGTDHWPMPIPLVQADGQWHFDTAAGKEEVINRHIGQDELCAIGVCQAYVKAQRKYAEMNASGDEKTYAQQFKSTPGQHDGLYWPADGVGAESPFGPLVAQAQAEGYGRKLGTGVRPFHGYYFRILTRQGEAAGGKMSYLAHGKLTGGFALVAYPEKWDQSGVMTFIVNQDGKVYQRNLGEKTAHIAGGMKEFNPDSAWTAVTDEGISDAVLEK